MKTLTISLLTAALLAAAPARAACNGSDILPELRRQDGAAAETIERQALAMPFASGKFFRLEKAGLKPSYLFGTMHVADPRVTAISAEVRKALESARVAAFELAEPGADKEDEVFAALGPKLADYIEARGEERSDRLLSPEDLAKLEKAVEAAGMPAEAARELKPSFLALTLGQPTCRLAEGDKPVLDAQLAAIARKKRIRVVGLETMEEQLAASTSFSPEDQRLMLQALLQVLDRREDIHETTIRRYVAGEIGLMTAWSRHPGALPGRVTAVPPPSFEATLIDERNGRMRDRALPHLARGGAFIAVGAAHLPGEKGLARLLEQSGYRVVRAD
ncbi:MAG TPA: TraB/GumN family protein [Microvirga sp.]|jgi:hypothetical protein|nr:TraB/GumN family protein [Microvirga sp.]